MGVTNAARLRVEVARPTLQILSAAKPKTQPKPLSTSKSTASDTFYFHIYFESPKWKMEQVPCPLKHYLLHL